MRAWLDQICVAFSIRVSLGFVLELWFGFGLQVCIGCRTTIEEEEEWFIWYCNQRLDWHNKLYKTYRNCVVTQWTEGPKLQYGFSYCRHSLKINVNFLFEYLIFHIFLIFVLINFVTVNVIVYFSAVLLVWTLEPALCQCDRLCFEVANCAFIKVQANQ